MFLKSVFITLILTIPGFCNEQDNLKPPYAGIEILPFDNHGWYSNSKRIKEIFKERKIETVVEIGSWLGKSTRHIATLLPEKGKIYAVDHWMGSVEHQNNERLPNLYQQFLSNVIHAKLTDKIVPIKMNSLDAANHLKNLKIDLVYIDGA